MLDDYVALDLETTGINPWLDSIIEVGLIRVRGGRVTDTFSTLVRPEVKIPLRIKNLTGIDDEMVADAPGFHQIRDTLEEFVRGQVVVGHSVGFDTGFLSRWMGGPAHSRAIDTLEMARVLMPSERSYRLGDLCASASLEASPRHRALDDARAAMLLFEHLALRLLQLDGHTGAQLERLIRSAGLTWSGLAGDFPGMPADVDLFRQGEYTQAWESAGAQRGDRGPWGCADPGKVEDLLSEGGLMDKSIPSFQPRFQQAEMAVEVARAFNEKKFLLVEAGTGTGKSLAYLIPSLLWAASGGPRVVISTGTINLQDQLWYKDIPELVRVLDTDVKVSLAKGRSNYVCLRRWESALSECRNGPEACFYARVLVWLKGTGAGDRVELNLKGQEEDFWLNICAERDGCQGQRCRHFYGRCFVGRARRQAEASGIIITNHALLFSDIKTGNMVLPEFGPLVIDEAHHLEDAAADQLGSQFSRSGFRRWMNGAGRVVARCWELVPLLDQEAWMGVLASLREGLSLLRAVSEEFFGQVRAAACRDSHSGNGDQAGCRVRGEAVCGDSQGPLWAVYRNYIFEFRNVLDGLRKAAGMMQAWAVENDSWEEKLREAAAVALGGEEMIGDLEFNFDCRDDSFVYWISVSGQGEWQSVSLHSSPVRVAGLLYESLYSARESVIMTSATLTVNGDFDFFTERSGIDRVYSGKVVKKIIESPFPYEKQSLLCLVSDLPNQGSEAGRSYIDTVGSALRDLIREVGGKTLVLFTSHRVLKEVYGSLKDGLEESGICVLGHNIDGNRVKLVDEFKRSGRAVLMGASSFWEGIDIPGEALTCVIIVKLPFMSPSEPVLEARMEDLEADGRNSFYEYYLPVAAMRFKQGFGRLIRSERDRGVVVVLDRRILEKGYGRYFIGSLPVKDYFSGDFKTVKRKIKDWLRTDEK